MLNAANFLLISRELQTPHAEIANAARGNCQRRTRGLPTPHAAFFAPSGSDAVQPALEGRLPAIIPSPAKCQAYRKEEQKKNR